jgi:hypothetical protein
MANKRGPKPGNAKGGVAPQSTQLARIRAHEIASSEKAPLNIMLDNMMFWHKQSQSLAVEIQETIATMKAGGADEQLVDKADKLLKGFVEARQNAQSCAVDAAPYIHPKLQSVTIKPLAAEVIEVVTQVASSGDRNEAVDYREDYNSNNVTPIRRVN